MTETEITSEAEMIVNYDNPATIAGKILSDIHTDINGRGGFDTFNIDDDILLEMIEEQLTIIDGHLS